MKIKLLLPILISGIGFNALCQEILDPTFATEGIAFSNSYEIMNSCHVKGDNKILLTGSTNNGAGNADFILAQFHEDGSPDQDFGTGIAVHDFGGQRNVSYQSAIQSDGKIIMVGATYNFPAQPTRCSSIVMRINPDGTLDTTFGDNGVVVHSFSEGWEMATSVTIGTDDTIYLGLVQEYDTGEFLNHYGLVSKVSPEGDTYQVLYIIPNGFEDNSSEIIAVCVQPDGKILFTGWRRPIIFADMALGRLNSDGTPDTDFGTDGYVYASLDDQNSVIEYSRSYALHLYGDGKILFGGHATNYDAEQSVVLLARVDTDGNPDPTFGTDGRAIVSFAADALFQPNSNAIMVMPNGRIMIGGAQYDNPGESTDRNFAFALCNDDGSPDASFGTDGFGSIPLEGTQRIMAMALQSGKVVATGYSQTGTDTGFAVMRLEETDLGIVNPEDLKLIVYPNPASQTLYFNTAVAADTNYIITDLNGRTIETGNTGIHGIDIENLAQGVYFLRAGAYKAVKFVKR